MRRQLPVFTGAQLDHGARSLWITPRFGSGHSPPVLVIVGNDSQQGSVNADKERYRRVNAHLNPVTS